ncbi:MAG: hypothetical protein KAI79_01705 [Bacteroidales bacterium]|nr:hypothetical protein [Bacteroidales bacterium]
MLKKITIITLFILLFMISPDFINKATAQPPPPAPIDIPIDGGLGLLIAAGIAYGAKKLYNSEEI